ncbi:PREDICTED: F-box protein At3g57580-like isoform X3 [Camelina sativa]|uniref:F-box protein At3g57580-like isoform X2 n=1 Tax=Camelina sativa TaxID=90675 RepID=A0ABM0YR59_CAMSA|nr:PREDICTED: F-box protein At3g57580-like isoform X2 [Camelina sativa]XP_010504691.1 PREDICTED: F-box protein At3g57580-like isoform X3 [Camelina sativa]
MERGKNMESLPTDLILEIFTRLPSKYVAKFRTLSKHWASTLRSSDFKKLFLARSSARPRLLFGVERYQHNEWFFFSSRQPQNRRYEKSLLLDYHTKVTGDVSSFVCSYASGLIYFPFVRIIEKDTPLICNPITGMYEGYEVMKYSRSHGFLGFDPIDEQFKVLDQDSILTIGSGEVNWRTKDISFDGCYDRCSIAGICINGVLFYLAITYGPRSFVLVRFDVRSEEFNFIDAACFNDHLKHLSGLSLVNSKGKLGVVNCNFADAGGRRTVELCMSVLEDVETQEWVKYVYTLPQNEVLESCEFKVAGVAATGDFVLCMKYTCNPYFVFYFNPEKNTLQSVEIHGFGAELEAVEDRGEVYAFVDHVEDLSVSDALQLKSSISHIKTLCACCKKVVQRDNIEEEV